MAEVTSHKNGNTTVLLSKSERDILSALLGKCSDDITWGLYSSLAIPEEDRKYTAVVQGCTLRVTRKF